MTKPSQTTPYPLRMPEELRARLESDAKLAGRSLQAEILRRLTLTLGSDPLALDPAQLKISIPNKLYNKIRRAAVENSTLPNDEIAQRLEASFEIGPKQDSVAPIFELALRLADSQGLFAGVLAALSKRLLEQHPPESFGLTEREYAVTDRLLSKSVHRIDYDESDITELLGIASLLGSIVPKEWPGNPNTDIPASPQGSSVSTDPLPTKRVTRSPQKKAIEGVQVHPPVPKKNP